LLFITEVWGKQAQVDNAIGWCPPGFDGIVGEPDGEVAASA
jgi:hypothetical protein